MPGIARQEDGSSRSVHLDNALARGMAADRDHAHPRSDVDNPVYQLQPSRVVEPAELGDFPGFGEVGEQRLPGQGPGPELIFLPGDVGTGGRDPVHIADVVVVGVRKDQDIGRGRDPQALQRCQRIHQYFAVPRPRRAGCVTGVHEDGGVFIADHPEVVPHGVLGVGFAVPVVV